MKFILKIEETMDKLILAILVKLKLMTPGPFFDIYVWIKDLPALGKKKHQIIQPKIRIAFLKLIGYSEYYLTMIRGHLVGAIIYLRSDEFKKKNKAEMVVAPLRKFKTDPLVALSVTLAIGFFSSTSYFIFINAQKIVIGTKAMRTPASSRYDQEPILEFRRLKYKTTLPAGTAVEVGLDVTIFATTHEELNKMLTAEEKILSLVKSFSVVVMDLPISEMNKQEIESSLKAMLLKEFHGLGIKQIEVKQVLDERPKYFLQTEKLLGFKNTNLQLFLEETKRNRQVWIDFTALSSNRFTVLYLKENMIQIQDHLNVNVEPVIPRLPLEEEGRQIIKDKIRDEINSFLNKEGVEGKILEIYIDYLIVT